MISAPAEFLAARHTALASLLGRGGLDALLVTHRPNISYLTGFFGSAALLLVTREGLDLFSDARYAEALRLLTLEVPSLTVEAPPPGMGSAEERLVARLGALGLPRVGFEAQAISVRQHTDLVARLRHAAITSELEAADGLVESLRVIKDPWETATLREAGRRLSDVAKCIIPKVLKGFAEREVAAFIERELRQKGFERPAFDTIVAAGPHAALPHYRAGDRALQGGDLVVMDFGGMLRGYAVDMTRTVVLGAPTRRQRECLEGVAASQQAAFAAAHVGAAPEDVDAAARQALADRGMGEAFVHGLGHGLGLEVHERPRLGPRREGMAEPPLAAGMMFTLEPGVYFPGWGGVRIEDDVLAAEAGPEWLTSGADEV
ncbi:MAG: aminopeptidase P family protein [Acidobacteria bacterium]|nr:aminopeptidase P family protein [Acidobacteriota bacterium]